MHEIDPIERAKECMDIFYDMQNEGLLIDPQEMRLQLEAAQAEALISIAQDLRYILGTIRDEGVVTK